MYPMQPNGNSLRSSAPTDSRVDVRTLSDTIQRREELNKRMRTITVPTEMALCEQAVSIPISSPGYLLHDTGNFQPMGAHHITPYHVGPHEEMRERGQGDYERGQENPYAKHEDPYATHKDAHRVMSRDSGLSLPPAPSSMELDMLFAHGYSTVDLLRGNTDGKSDGCCDSLLKCLGLIPCPTLLSWILLLLGIGCFTGSLLIATWRTRDLLDNDALLWFMEYAVIGVVSGMFVFGCMFLIFGHLSSEPNSRRVFNSTSKNKCAQGMNVFAVVLAFFLTVVWVLLTSVLSTPLVFIINFFIVEPDPLNLAVYGLSNATFSGLALEEFKGDTKDLLITYGVAFFGCIMVIISLIGFIISMSSNIAHLKDQRFATLNAYGENDVRNSKHSVVDTTM